MWNLCLAAALSQGVTGPWLAMMTMTFGSSITQVRIITEVHIIWKKLKFNIFQISN